MVRLFGLPSGIPPVSFEISVACLHHISANHVTLKARLGPGTCVLAIASLVDVGDIPSKPDVSGEGSVGVIATWQAVSEYVQLLSETCLVRRSELGWTGYGKQAVVFLSYLCFRVLNVAA